MLPTGGMRGLCCFVGIGRVGVALGHLLFVVYPPIVINVLFVSCYAMLFV